MKKVLLVLLLFLISFIFIGCKDNDVQAEIRGLNDYIYQLEKQIDTLEDNVESLEKSRQWMLERLGEVD